MHDLTKLAVVAAALGAAGCKLPDNSGTPDAPSCGDIKTPTRQYDYTGMTPTCPPWLCGTNSATVGDGVVFDTLDGSGREPGPNGIRIMSMSAKLGPALGSRPVELYAERDQLFARELAPDATGMNRTHSGRSLVDTTFVVTAQIPKSDPPITVMHELKIVEVNDGQTMPLHYWAYNINDGFARDEAIPFYRITSRRLDVACEPVNICRQDVADTDSVWSGPLEHSALVFAGDRYRYVDHPDHQVMDVDLPTTWFNLACAGTAAAKMHLMRHTNAGAYVGNTVSYQTTLDQRNAMLKMFTADYCGTGTAFTVDGQRLGYLDANDWYRDLGRPMIAPDGSVIPSSGKIEALWGPTGAVCLDNPRRASAALPVTRSDVSADCGLASPPVPDPPSCTIDGRLKPEYLPWQDHAHVISVVVP